MKKRKWIIISILAVLVLAAGIGIWVGRTGPLNADGSSYMTSIGMAVTSDASTQSMDQFDADLYFQCGPEDMIGELVNVKIVFESDDLSAEFDSPVSMDIGNGGYAASDFANALNADPKKNPEQMAFHTGMKLAFSGNEGASKRGKAIVRIEAVYADDSMDSDRIVLYYECRNGKLYVREFVFLDNLWI